MSSITHITLAHLRTELQNPTPEELNTAVAGLVEQAIAIGLNPQDLRVKTESESDAEIAASTSASMSTSATTLASDDMAATSAASEIQGGGHDTIGELRSLADLDLARAAGFAPRATVYRRGTRVIDVGVRKAAASRAKFEAMPTVADGCAALMAAVQAENRYEETVPLTSIEMGVDGTLSAPGAFLNEPVEEAAFCQYATMLAHGARLKSGAAFLASMTGDGEAGVALRAHVVAAMRRENLNREEAQRVEVERARQERAAAGIEGARVGDIFEPRTIKVRARDNGVFALVGPDYPCFDADQVAAAIAKTHAREGMRLDFDYNGRAARFNIIAQTPVQPQEFVAGEFFRVGYRITTADDGKGALKISIMIWQNLCLNLIIVDKGSVEIASIRHRGDVARLAKELDSALLKAQSKIGPILDKWNYAAKTVINTENTAAAPGHKLPERLSNEDLMAGVFRSLIERDLIPVGARKADDAVKALVNAYAIDGSAASVNPATGERRFTRGSVVNAVTRVAHDATLNAALGLDMDDEDLWERAGGRFLDANVPMLWTPSKAEIKAAAAAEAANTSAADISAMLAK